MNITIVGGGTAGWITALLIAKRYPSKHKITVIESSRIGIIGVGESTTGVFTNLITNGLFDLGLDLNDFIVQTGATLKYGIKHQSWTKNINDYYFAPIDSTRISDGVPDPIFSYAHGYLDDLERPKATSLGFKTLTDSVGYNSLSGWTDLNWAMHVDSHLVGKYFKKICLQSNIKLIDSEVDDVVLNEKGFIKSLKLSNDDTLDSEFFIDCTGFNRKLMSKLSTEWVSYKEYLPVNSGIPFLTKYKEDEYVPPYTTAWAQSSGWLWSIPLLDRKGNGYVYCDSFISEDSAKREIENRLNDNLDFNNTIKFESGRVKNTWVKNCLVIGLSSNFLEPLEATSIHNTLVQATGFVFEFLKPSLEETVNQGSINLYNSRTSRMFDHLRDFVSLHYASGREDTEFWKYMTYDAKKSDFILDLIETCKHRVPTINDFPEYFGAAGWPLYSYILAGIGKLSKEVCKKTLEDSLPQGNLLELSKNTFQEWLDENYNISYNEIKYQEWVSIFRTLRNN